MSVEKIFLIKLMDIREILWVMRLNDLETGYNINIFPVNNIFMYFLTYLYLTLNDFSCEYIDKLLNGENTNKYRVYQKESEFLID